MNIQDLGSLGELVAAFATIATLLYLAVQIRQNNRNLHESTSASEVVGSLYQSYPGVRSIIDSLEPATPRDLVKRLGQAKPTYSFIEK